MVLAGARLPQLPALTLSNQTLTWVEEIKYLGFPIYTHSPRTPTLML